MLDLFRARGITNVVYGVVIAATILVFVIQFRPNAGQKSASIKTTCVATVRGWCIDPKDHRAAVLLMVRGPQGELSPQAMAQLKIKQVALDGLIERELLVGEAGRLGLVVSEQEVTDQLFDGYVRVSIPSDNLELQGKLPIGRDGMKMMNFRDPKTKLFDLKLYERRIKNETGRSATEFREEQTRELLAAKMRDLVRAPIRVSEAEAYEAYLRQYNTATVSYVHVSPTWAAQYAVTATDAEVATWQNDHKADLDKEFDARKEADLPKAGRVRHILAMFNQKRTPPTLEERAAAWGKISEAYARLKRGEPFAQVARDMSEDPGSKNKGGGYDSMDGFDPFFKRTADGLKPGETTVGAIETMFGFHILLKDDPAKSADVEAAVRKALARSALLKSKGTEAAKELTKKVVEQMKAGKSGDDAVKAIVAQLVPSGKAAPLEPAKIIVDTEPPKPALADGGAPRDAGAADATVAKQGAGAATADAGAKPAALPMKVMTAESDPSAPKVETSAPFSSGGDPFTGLTHDGQAAVLKFAFRAGAKDGDVMDDAATGFDGLFAVLLKERHVATREDFDKERDVQLARLLTAKQNEALALYVRRLKETAKAEIKKDDALLREPDGGAGAAQDDEEP